MGTKRKLRWILAGTALAALLILLALHIRNIIVDSDGNRPHPYYVDDEGKVSEK